MHATSAASERNWSVWGHVYTKCRNMLKLDKASKIIFIRGDSEILAEPDEEGHEEYSVFPDYHAIEPKLHACSPCMPACMGCMQQPMHAGMQPMQAGMQPKIEFLERFDLTFPEYKSCHVIYVKRAFQ
eukprot:361046-Chlamydomonas_euryale.AAC.1